MHLCTCALFLCVFFMVHFQNKKYATKKDLEKKTQKNDVFVKKKSMYFLFRKFWEKKFLRKKNFSKNRFSKKSKMSNCGYTTETFALVYILFDAFYILRADSSKKKWTPTLEKKSCWKSHLLFDIFFDSVTVSKNFGLNRLGVQKKRQKVHIL